MLEVAIASLTAVLEAEGLLPRTVQVRPEPAAISEP